MNDDRGSERDERPTLEVDENAEYERELFQLRELRVKITKIIRQLERKIGRAPAPYE